MTTKTNKTDTPFRLHIPTAEDLHLPDAVKHFLKIHEYVSPTGASSGILSSGLVLTTGYHREINKIALANEYVLHSGQPRGPVRILSRSEESIFSYTDNERSVVACIPPLPDENEKLNASYYRILRFRPDCVIFGDILSVNEANAAIALANRGFNVFASISARSAAQALHNLVHLFPAEDRSEIQKTLAGGLLGVLNQVCRVHANQKEFSAWEVLNGDDSVKRHILSGEFRLLDDDIQNGDPDKMLGREQSFTAMKASDSEVDWNTVYMPWSKIEWKLVPESEDLVKNKGE